MNYIKVKWIHSLPQEPVWLYSELDEERWEIRKIEIYADGSLGYADATRAHGSTRLGECPIPPLTEISCDHQFEAVEITDKEFDDIWSQRDRR